jgi:hypothetical protein
MPPPAVARLAEWLRNWAGRADISVQQPERLTP